MTYIADGEIATGDGYDTTSMTDGGPPAEEGLGGFAGGGGETAAGQQDSA